MSLLLEDIGLICRAFDFHSCRYDFKRLLIFRGRDIFSGNADAGTGQDPGYFLDILQCRMIDDLGILEVGAVIELDKTDLAVVAVGTYPAFQFDIFDLILFHCRCFVRQCIQFSDSIEI